MNAGLVVEVWCKGFLWDRFLGYYYIPLSEVSYMNEVTRNQCNLSRTAEIQDRQSEQSDMCDTNSNTQPDIITDTETTGQWINLGLELEQRGNDIIGTKKPTGHSLLIDCRLELPYGNRENLFSLYRFDSTNRPASECNVMYHSRRSWIRVHHPRISPTVKFNDPL
ncbi:Phorbol ester/diacylglycerol-binding protein unc-13 [Cyphomyrmex costatus]|uniref:Phorbol ester/diacylglycerol-binding protein unc-13 n=1 Tax=Cyphomyrmex costatus TaxID=456900 RepID=A0A195CQV6_9HYME|nr:Phorbol ester/diacylglycerol-binding protein unc-13 [Cyphomyrmex costatus]